MARYTPKLFEKICDRIACGESVAAICRSKGFPSRESFYQWTRRDSASKKAYLKACAMRSQVYVEQIMDVLDNLGNEATSNQINAARLRIDATKWVASKLQPRLYGDRIKIDDEREEVKPPTPEELLAMVETVALSLGKRVVDYVDEVPAPPPTEQAPVT